MLRSWNHQHTVTHVPSPLVTGPAPEEESINFPPCCQSYPETYTDVFGLRCHGNSLIHWSAVVTILHSGMITPHWDLGRREQLKVVTVKRAYPLVGYVNFNDRLTDDLWFPLFRRLCRLRQIHRTCLSWTHSYSYINSTATHSSYLTYSFKIASWYIHESSLNPCNLPWCRCNLLKLRHTEIDAYVSSCTYNFKRKVAHLVTTPKHLCCEAVFRPVLFSLSHTFFSVF